eukprot:6225179-Karenia_brevis.AAC.1
MQQASMFAMKGKLEQPARIEVISLDNPQANAAVRHSHHASMIKREYDRLSLEHQQGAAIEYQIHKVWDLLTYLALEHKQHAAKAQDHSNNIHRVIQELGNEIDAMAALPNCQEAVEQYKSLYYQWIKPHMTRIRHAQELAKRM